MPRQFGGGSHPPSVPRTRTRSGLRRLAAALSVVIAAESAVLLMNSGQAIAIGQAAPRAEAPKAAPVRTGPATAPDEASARLKARLEQRRIEVLDGRSETVTTWVNPDGSVTQDLATGPVRFRDGAGQWQDVDPSLVIRPDGKVAAKGHPLGLTLAGRTAAPKGRSTAAADGSVQAPSVPLVTLNRGEGGPAMTLSWRGALPTPTVDGTRARYADALTATDLIIESTRTGFEQFLELKDRSAVAANGSVTMTLDAKGLTAHANQDGSVTFLDPKTGKEAGVLPAPVMWDAQVDPHTGDHRNTAPVGLKVSQNGDAVDLTLTPDAAFLNNPKTQYPVTVDPAVNIGVGFDTFVQQGYATDVSTQTELKLGNNGSGQVARSFLQFPMAKITGKQIQSAKLNLWNFHSWSCTAKSWEVWDTGTATTSTRWTAQPGWNRKWASSTATKGYSTSCGDGWVNTDITSLVQAWANNGYANNTLGIRATDETDEFAWKKFNSGNAAANTPYLSVTYNTKPGAATPVSPLSGTLTKDGTPTLTGKATDPDGNTVQLSYEIWTSTGTAALQTGKSAFVTSGTNAPWTPTTALAPGAYKWRAAVYDGSTWNGTWSAWQNFTVDTTLPAATTVSSGDFPAGAWSGSADGSGNFTGNFTFTPPSSDVKDIQYKLDTGTWVTVATTGAAVTKALVFKAGAHTVTAHTRDAAGNVSADRTYTFYAGSGSALSSPGDGERPARRTSLKGEGKSSYTGVRYQYRRGETDAWKDVPVANVLGTDGKALTAWPFAAPGGKPAALTWNITDTLAEDGPVDVRAVFTDGTATDASGPNTVTVDRRAGTAPSAGVGPGSVNALTGDFSLSAGDGSAFGLSAGRFYSSRTPDAGVSEEGQAAIFGPQWSAGTIADSDSGGWSHLRQTSATSLAIVNSEGEETGFTAASAGGWTPEPGSEDLTLTGSFAGTFSLKDRAGSTIVFGKVDAAATSWQVTSTTPVAGDGSSVISEKVVVGGRTVGRPKYVVSTSSAVPAATCGTTPATKGCKVLEYVYASTGTATGTAFGDVVNQVKQIRLWSTEPGAGAATPVTVTEYRYDDRNRLREVWDPRITPAVKTAYGYDAAGRIATLTPSGELPWTFTYGKAGNAATAGDGMLLNASRPTLRQGSRTETDGTATTSVVYDVPLSGSAAPHQMGNADVAAWGQSDAPTDAVAVLPTDAVPAGHDGRTLTAAAYAKAVLTYTNASGRQVNSAVPGGGVSTTQYDRFGNTVFELSAANRTLALSTASEAVTQQRSLGLDGKSTADRAQALASLSVYDADGQQVLEQTGPLHLVALERDLAAAGTSPALPAGAEIPARAHTVTAYDEGRPAGAAQSGLPTSVTTGARIDGYPADADARTVATGYDWTTGQPVITVEDPNGLRITKSTAYDAEGRVVRNTMPNSNGGDAGTSVTSYWSATGTGACAGRPEWAGLTCTTGPAAPVTGGQPAELPVKYFEYDRWGKPRLVTETANGLVRTTTMTYDEAGRTVKATTTGGIGTAVPESTTTYDPATGRVAGTSDGTATVSQAYDLLGRQVSYDDGAGSVTTTEYDPLNRVVRRADSAPSSISYVYDAVGRPSSVTDSAAGTVTGSYDSAGNLLTETLPGGVLLTLGYDTQGELTAKTYTAADGALLLSDRSTASIHGQQLGHTQTDGGTTDSDFGYDRTGRLVKAADRTLFGCATRAYGFDNNSNRTSLTTVTDDCDTATADALTTSTGYGYDAADRLTGTGIGYDAFGRTTSTASGTQLSYYASDLVRSETTANRRTTWSLDGVGRLAATTVETKAEDGSWTASGTSTNHYSASGDSPAWTRAGDGTVTRSLRLLDGQLAALIGGVANGTVLQLTNLHGDVAVQLPLEEGAQLLVQHYDEFGNRSDGTAATRYGWLGGQQRASDTGSGLTVMGVRLYDSATGRFLQSDPVAGGNPNAYVYPTDPVNMSDLSGAYSYSKRYYLGYFFSTTATEVMKFVRTHFWVFPLTGCGANLTYGERCNLAGGNPVKVTQLGRWHWQFTSLKGHAEGAGKKIRFEFDRSGGNIWLSVSAWGPDNTWCNRNRPCSWLNTVFAKTIWWVFAVDVSFYLSVYGYW